MKIQLQSSLRAVFRANDMYVNHIDLLRVINIASPRKWYISIRFEGDGSNNVFIHSEIPMSLAEIRQALDGRLPVFYGANAISYFSENSYLASKPYAVDDTIEVEFHQTNKKMSCEISLNGFGDISFFQNEDALRGWLYQHTWLGSSKFSGRNAFVSVELFGHKYKISPRSHHVREGVPVLEKNITLNSEGVLCEVLLTILPKKSHQNTIRHAKYGVFTIEDSCPGFWRSLHPLGDVSVNIEIDDNGLSWWSKFGPENSIYLKRLGGELVSSLTSLASSSDYKKFVKQLGEWEKHQSAARLDKRQTQAENRAKIYIGNKELLCLPTCENEVLCLYSKLEALDAIPIECSVIEYTAKLGIDALGHFRFSNSEVLNKYSPIEFEMYADNFLAHEHPFEQTRLIVCWDVVDEDNFRREPGKPWLRKLRNGGLVIPVLVLKDIPKIKIVTKEL